MEQTLADRTALSDDNFAAQCGDEISPNVVHRIRKIMAEVSESSTDMSAGRINPALLRPCDRMCDDLAYEMDDSLSYCDLLARIEKEFSIRLKLRDLEKLQPRTVGDMARIVSARLAASPR